MATTTRKIRIDTTPRIMQAYRTCEDKLGPAFAISFMRAGFSTEFVATALEVSKSTLYSWIFGDRPISRIYHRRRVERMMHLCDIAVEKGTLPLLQDGKKAAQSVAFATAFERHKADVERRAK